MKLFFARLIVTITFAAIVAGIIKCWAVFVVLALFGAIFIGFVLVVALIVWAILEVFNPYEKS